MAVAITNKHRMSGLCVAAILLASGSPVAAQDRLTSTISVAHETAAAEVDNAALLYNRAWQLGDPHFARAFVRGDWQLTPEFAERLKANQPMIEMLLRATRVKACDWGIEYEEGFNALLPHLGLLRSSARTLVADARRLAQEGEHAEAAKRLDATVRMATHLEQDRVVISGLVAMAIAQLAADETVRLIEAGELPRARTRLLERRLGAIDLDDPFELTGAIAGEHELLEAWLAALPEGESSRVLADASAQFGGKHADTFRAMDDAQVAAEVALLERYYEDALAMWPAADAAERYARLEDALQAGAYGSITPVFAASVTQVRVAAERFAEQIRGALDAIEGG